MKAVRVLKRELISLHNRGSIEQRDISYLFGKVREILENKGNYRESFPELNLFCNWCAHSKLSGSKTIYAALLNVSKLLSKVTSYREGDKDEGHVGKFLEISSSILNIPNLRKGLKTVLEEEGLPSYIVTEKKWWDVTLLHLIHEISEKPLEFPDSVVKGINKKGPGYKYFNELMELSTMENKDKIFRMEIKLDKTTFVIHFTSLNNVTLIVPLVGMEDDDAFIS